MSAIPLISSSSSEICLLYGPAVQSTQLVGCAAAQQPAGDAQRPGRLEEAGGTESKTLQPKHPSICAHFGFATRICWQWQPGRRGAAGWQARDQRKAHGPGKANSEHLRHIWLSAPRLPRSEERTLARPSSASWDSELWTWLLPAFTFGRPLGPRNLLGKVLRN